MKKQNLLFYLGYFLISVLIISVMTHFSQWNCFCDDDFYYAKLRPYENIFHPLNPFGEIHGCGYIGYWLLTFLAYSLPNYILHINPSDFISFQHGIIRGCFVVITLSMLLMFFRQSCKNKGFQLLVYFLLCGLFFYLGVWSNIITLNYSFYRYFLSLLPMGYLFYYLYRHTTVKHKKQNKPQIVLACFCAYIVGMSSEIEIYSTLTLFFLLLGFSLLTKSAKNFKLNFGADVWIILGVFLISMLIFTTSSGFREVAGERGMSHIVINLGIIKEYSALYLKNCFINVWGLWALFIAAFIYAFRIALKRKNDIKKLIFPVLLQLSLFIVMFSLVLCGKTNYFGTYFIVHENVLSLFYFLTTIPALIFFGYCLKNMKSDVLKTTLGIILFLSACFLMANSHEINSKYLLQLRAKSYILQKIALYEFYKDNQIFFPPEVETHYFPGIYNEDNIFEFKYFIKDVYNTDRILETPLTIDENAIEKFTQLGGSFGEKEIEELKFQNLNNESYVLKKQDDELSAEEILEIFRQ